MAAWTARKALGALGAGHKCDEAIDSGHLVARVPSVLEGATPDGVCPLDLLCAAPSGDYRWVFGAASSFG
jgi:hypothetical protein